MSFIFNLVFGCLVLKFSGLPETFARLGQYGQGLCVRLSPPSEYQDLYQTLVCGTKHNNPQIITLFLITGFLQMVVASGCHLFWLEQWIEFLPQRSRSWVLLGYVFASGWHCAMVRCFLNRLFVRDLPTSLRIAVSGVITWGLIPVAEPVFGLQISWLCALIFLLGRFVTNKKFVSFVMLHFLLGPLLVVIPIIHPLSILSNVLFLNSVGAVLFPLSVLSFFIHKFALVVDLLWWSLLEVMTWMAPYMTTTDHSVFQDELTLWCFVFVMQSIMYLIEIYQRRSEWQKALQYF